MSAQPLLTADEWDSNGSIDHSLPRINISRQHRDVVEDVITALKRWNNPPRLFQRGGVPVRIRRDEDGQPIIEQITDAAMRLYISKSANLWKSTSFGEKPAPPDRLLVQSVLAHYELQFPALRRITQVPIVRKDGSVCDSPGYDPSSAIFYDPDRALTIPGVPENPSDEELRMSISMISDEVLGDFPFEDQASRANTIAMFLLPFARELIDGTTPFHLIDKPEAGTGSGLLVDCFTGIVSGKPASIALYTRDESEMRKALTSNLLRGAEVVLFDNIDVAVRSGVLSAVLTARSWSDRLLGGNVSVELPNRAVWIGTGNNVQLGGDMPRRVIPIRMNAKVERPWARPASEFKHPDLRSFVRQNRSQLIWSCLVIVRAWVAAGRPKTEVQPLGSFETWSYVMANILNHAGVAGFLESQARFWDTADDSATRDRAFIEQLFSIYQSNPWTASEIGKSIEEEPSKWGDALPEFPRNKQSTAKKLGYWLRKKKGMVFSDTFRLEQMDGTVGRNKVAQWTVLRTKHNETDVSPATFELNKAGDAGYAGDVSTGSHTGTHVGSDLSPASPASPASTKQINPHTGKPEDVENVLW